MLPNWLYGKSLRKLQEILNSGGQTAAGVSYSNTESGLEATNAQAAIDEVVEELDTKAALTQITNPNLLDNPWFTVNQHGFTTAASASSTYVADRWKVVSASGITITNSANGITIDNTNGATYVTIETLLETSTTKCLLGRKLTISLAKVIGETDAYKTLTMPDSLPESSTIIDTVLTEEYTLRVIITGSGYLEVDVQVKEGKSITIRAIKLELGDVSTLAKDARPNYATELIKCQRFFKRIVIGERIGRIDNGGDTIRFGLSEVENMRSNPSAVEAVDSEVGLNISGAGAQYWLTKTTDYSLSANKVTGIVLSLKETGKTKVASYTNQIVGIWNSNQYIDLSAEL